MSCLNWRLLHCSELIYILGGQGRHGDLAARLWHLLPRPEDAEGVGEIPRRSQEQRPPQTRTGMDIRYADLSFMSSLIHCVYIV